MEQPSNPVEPRPQSPVGNIISTYSDEQLKWLRSKKLCDECQSIFHHWPIRETWESQRPHHTHHDLAGLNSSARNGCPVCEMFLDNFVYENPIKSKWPKSDLKALVAVSSFSSGSCYIILEFGTQILPSSALLAVMHAGKKPLRSNIILTETFR